MQGRWLTPAQSLTESLTAGSPAGNNRKCCTPATANRMSIFAYEAESLESKALQQAIQVTLHQNWLCAKFLCEQAAMSPCCCSLPVIA